MIKIIPTNLIAQLISAVLTNTLRHKKVDLFKKLVHSNSCQADQDIAP